MKINSSVAANSYLLDAVTNNIDQGISVRSFSLHSVRSIIMRLMLVVMIVGGWNVVMGQTTETDVLNRTLTGVTGTSYTDWSGKTSNSSAVYAGQSAGGNSSIQLRTKNSNSGIITTASGGRVTKVIVTWNSNTASGRTLNIYGKNTAYSEVTDLYNTSTQGTLLGTIVYGTSTELTISGDYTYIGLRSASDAMYLDEIKITWTIGSSAYSVTYNANGATSGIVPTDNTSYSSGDLVTVKGNTGSLVKTEHTFAGWNTATDGTGTDRAVGSTFNITSNTTLYAKWTPNQYNVTWHVGGNTPEQTGPYNYGSTIPAGDVPTPTSGDCAGKTFIGWSTAEVAETDDEPPLATAAGTTVNGEMNYYAVFAEAGGGGDEWTQVTSLSNITDGEYVIVSDGFYLPNTETGSGNAPSAIPLSPVTISGNKLIGTISSEMQWKFTVSGSLVTIRPNIANTSNYLYETANNNGVRVYTTPDTWTFYNYTSGSFYMQGTNNSRFCATYDSHDWRSYVSYNHTNYGDGGKIYLFKYNDVTYYAYSTSCVPCEADPAISATALNFSDITSSSVTVEAPGGITSFGENCHIRSYGFVYGTSANPTLASGTVAVAGTSYTTANSSFNKIIDGLSPCTTYHVRAYATNGHGTVYGSDCTFTTGSEAEIIGLISVNGETSATLYWNLIGEPCVSGHYVVICRQGSSDIASSCSNSDFTSISANAAFGSGTETGTGEYVVYSGSETSAAITNLTSGSTYTSAVFYVDDSGNCLLREQITFVYTSITLLERGDLAIVGVNYNTGYEGEDEISFVTFKQIKKGTPIDLTDNGYERKFPGLWGTSEGILRFTWNDNTPLPQGSFITIKTSQTTITSGDIPDLSSHITVYVNGSVATSKWNLSFFGNSFGYNSDDQIWIMQGGEWVEDLSVDVSGVDGNHKHNMKYTGNVLYGFTATGWMPNPNYDGIPIPGSDDKHYGTRGSTMYPGCECFNTNITFASNGGRVKYKGVISPERSKYEWIGLMNDISNWQNFEYSSDYNNAVYNFTTITQRLPISDDVPSTNVWAGYKDENWCNCANWYYQIVPDRTTDVTIPEITSPRNIVNIPANDIVECKNLTIEDGGSLSSNDNDAEMSVYGNLVVESGGQLSLANTNPMTLKLNGNLSSEGNFTTYRGLSMDLLSASAQNIGDVSSGDFALNNLTFRADGNTFDATTIKLFGNLNDLSPSSNGLGTQEIHFVGDVQQTINNNTAISNVTINNTSDDGVVVASGKMLNVSAEAIFVDGVVNGNVTFSASATSAGASTDSYVDGTVTKKANASAFSFPTGSNGVLGKLDVTGLGADTDLKFNHEPDGFSTSEMPVWWNQNNMCPADGSNQKFDHVSNMYFWNLGSSADMTDAVFTVSATDDVHFNVATVEHEEADIYMALYDNCWKNLGGTAVTESPDYNYITVSDVDLPATRATGSKIVTFGSIDHNTLLPIELLSFAGECKAGVAKISWTTATERNNDYFVLERSHDAFNFVEVARIAGAGNSTEPLSYVYTDYNAGAGSGYYRLVQVDYDGTSTVSEMIVVDCKAGSDGEPDVKAYPNPFAGELTLRFENFGGMTALVEVYDMLGRLVVTREVACSQNDYELVMPLGNLPDGAYNVRVSSAELVINRQVIKE